MKYNGVHAKIQYNDRQKTFIGRTLDLNDVLEFKGNSVESLRQQFKKSVDDYLLHCKKSGKPARRAFSGRLALRIEPSLHSLIALKSAEEGISINQWVERALRAAVLDNARSDDL